MSAELYPSKESIIKTNRMKPEEVSMILRSGGWVDATAFFRTLPDGEREIFAGIENDLVRLINDKTGRREKPSKPGLTEVQLDIIKHLINGQPKPNIKTALKLLEDQYVGELNDIETYGRAVARKEPNSKQLNPARILVTDLIQKGLIIPPELPVDAKNLKPEEDVRKIIKFITQGYHDSAIMGKLEMGRKLYGLKLNVLKTALSNPNNEFRFTALLFELTRYLQEVQRINE